MNLHLKTAVFVLFAAFLAAETSAALPPCGPPTTNFECAGSDTIAPIVESWDTAYSANCPGVNVLVSALGSGDGAKRVCGAKLPASDIGDMSRQWNTKTEANSTDGINYKCIFGTLPYRSTIQVEMAADGITVAMIGGGFGAQCVRRLAGKGLTLGQLRWMYSSYNSTQLLASGWSASELPNSDNNESTHFWSELDPTCPKAEIIIAGPDNISGTFSLFQSIVLTDLAKGEKFANKRPNAYYANGDFDGLLNFLSTSSAEWYGDAIAFFPFAYVAKEGAFLYSTPIKNSAGVYVKPSIDTITDLTYNPFSRRLYMNLFNNVASLAQTRPFMQFGLSQAGTKLVTDLGYVGLSLADRNTMLARIGAPAVADFTAAPTSVAPTASPTPAPCGVLGQSIFCLNGCGLFDRIRGLC